LKFFSITVISNKVFCIFVCLNNFSAGIVKAVFKKESIFQLYSFLYMFVTNWTENVNHFTSNHLLHSNFGNAGVDKPIGMKT
jgi:hypothetical protein